jgi:hypothetical protein
VPENPTDPWSGKSHIQHLLIAGGGGGGSYHSSSYYGTPGNSGQGASRGQGSNGGVGSTGYGANDGGHSGSRNGGQGKTSFSWFPLSCTACTLISFYKSPSRAYLLEL